MASLQKTEKAPVDNFSIAQKTLYSKTEDTIKESKKPYAAGVLSLANSKNFGLVEVSFNL